MREFRKLKVWEKAHELVLDAYRIIAGFPREELYRITAQPRRASVSIPANIAEGWGREGEAELRRFLRIGLGSASELEYHLLLARDLSVLISRRVQENHWKTDRGQAHADGSGSEAES